MRFDCDVFENHPPQHTALHMPCPHQVYFVREKDRIGTSKDNEEGTWKIKYNFILHRGKFSIIDEVSAPPLPTRI